MWNKQNVVGYSIVFISLVSTTTLAYINTIIPKTNFITTKRPSKSLQHNTVLSAVVEESTPTNKEKSSILVDNIQKSASILAVSTALLTLTNSPIIANAYASTDYAGDTVTSAVRMLEDATGNREKMFDAYKNIRDIITEGKGVGGSLSYGGLDLQRGVVADEDTTIYNPGLSLLTESEKNTLVQAVVQSKKDSAPTAETSWSDENESAYNFLKKNLDPFSIVEISGYLSVFPLWGAVLYLVNIFVQQNARAVFPASYLLGVVLVFAPALALIALAN